MTLHARGSVGPDEVRDAMDASSLVALPSVWAEPFGYVGIEAFARARPVVAYDVGGVGAWLEQNRNGIVVGRGNEVALGDAMQMLLDDDPNRERLGRNARSDAERFRLAPTVGRLLNVYRSA